MAGYFWRRWTKGPDTTGRARLETALRASRYCRWGLHVFNIRPTVRRQSRIRAAQGGVGMVVANHTSYVDPIVLCAVQPAVYVTSMEMRDSFFLGDICRAAGCLFVERRDPRKAGQDMAMLAERLHQNLPVAIYPEGTSSDGSAIKPFKPTLIQAAVVAKQPLAPAVFRWRALAGHPVTRHNRDSVCWYGDMTFFDHVWAFAGIRSIACEVDWLPHIPGTDRKGLASAAHSAIRNSYTAIR
jgi:1-acyl-sn-glycerol-3-phosphate acyltransferase